MKYKLFPKLEDVFVEVTDAHRVVFFPLLTIDLSSIKKGEGELHFISYFRDGEDDIISDVNFSYNFMRFKMVGNKYQFDGDFNKIHLFEKSKEWYKEAKEIYQEHREKYLSNSNFIKEEDKRRKEIDFEYYYYIQGVLNYWVTRDKYLETGKFIQGGAYTYGESNLERTAIEDVGSYDEYCGGYPDEILEEVLDELKIDFKDLSYIGTVAGYNYVDFGADETMLFKNGDSEVFQYYNWS